MGVGRLEMEHDQAGEVGAVPYGIHTSDRPPSVPEHICLGPQTQHIPLHSSGVYPQSRLEGAPMLPLGEYADPYTPPPSPPAPSTNMIGCHVLRTKASHPQAITYRDTVHTLDLRGNLALRGNYGCTMQVPNA